MRLSTVEIAGNRHCVACLSGDRVLALAAADDSLPAIRANDMTALIAGWGAARGAVATLVARAEAGELAHAVHPASAVRFLAPIPRPAKNVFCVGRNYAEHIAEGARAQNTTVAVTEVPVYFTKPPTAVIGAAEPVLTFPALSTQTDYEVELAVIIGTPGRDIPKDRALDHVFGYTILNDITARDVQRRHGGQYFKGKGLDGSCPMGPWIVTADDLPDPQAVGIRLWVNGEKRQDSTTAAMIFDIPTLIASLSEGLTLEPGDIIATGTPSGVGYAMTPPRFLTDGDEVTCEIDGIGRLSNRVRAV
ncbi:MAG: fumarylacetoacetate hydrolase family protein [Paracoccaceae bacterium]|nr:MAG: fumarylacetoacetate hydrolase family protein [Paracoccaceae bacterium]